MIFQPFKLEEYFSKWEFKARYLMCTSDPQTISVKELLDEADSESRKLWDELQLGYGEAHGHPLVLEEIKKLYDHPESLHCGAFAGGSEGIFCALSCLVKKDDLAVVITPCYQSHIEMPRSLGCIVETVELKQEGDRWKVDMDQLRLAFKKSPKIFLMNFPHNPTGATLTASELYEIVTLARAHGTWILSDEVYRFSEFESQTRQSAICDVYERGISYSVLTKAFGLAGLRLGWLTCQDKKLIDDAINTKLYLSICNSGPSEVLSIVALRQRERLLARIRNIVLSNLKLIQDFQNKHSDLISWIPPLAGGMGFPRLHEPSEKFSEDLIKETGVLILPGTVFGDFPHHFRIGFGRSNFSEAFEIFTRFLLKRFHGK